MASVSPLGPIDPSSVASGGKEEEKEASWIVRKVVQSMTGRIVSATYESLRAGGTGIICLSPWGDSSPLTLPCIRFRDVAVHTIVVATGGMAVVAAPLMGPAAEVAVNSFGSGILVEIVLKAGFELTTKVADDLVFDKPINKLVPIHSERLETTHVKKILITLQFKHMMTEAALGFFRSSMHEDGNLFANVQDYLAVEKGWLNPYLFASRRRPVIPRPMKPDVIFCHGPFLAGDYSIGSTLLKESAMSINLSGSPLIPVVPEPSDSTTATSKAHSSLSIPALKNMLSQARSRIPSPEPTLAPLPAPPAPRRMVILLVGIKPHRSLWTTSARPGESVIYYQLLNGCPAIVVPVKVGAPLVAWDGMTLEDMWKMGLPEEGVEGTAFEGFVKVLFEYLDLCVDWDRVVLEGKETRTSNEEQKRAAVRDALTLLVAGAVRSKISSEVKKEVDEDRSGIAMWRIP